MILENRQALIIGMGKSGIAAAKFLINKGVRVTICDSKGEDELAEQLSMLKNQQVEIIAGNYPSVDKFDFLVVSPGVPLEIEPIAAANRKNIPVLGEVELGFQFCSQPIVAITGTNGKTTTTALTGEILAQRFNKVIVGGNIGVAFLEQIENVGEASIVVLEVSSFQLETTVQLRPKVAAILNITPDHLDRHGTFHKYVEAKKKIFANQMEEDYLILNYDQEQLRVFSKEAKSKVIFFSVQHNLEEGVFIHNNQVIVRIKGENTVICSTKDIKIRGQHNWENCLAAIAMSLVLGVSIADIRETLTQFPGVAHRLEPVAVIDGVEYINDSKGTNPDATEKAIAAIKQPIILILGGKDKGSDFAHLLIKGKEKIKTLIVIGETTDKILATAKQVGIDQIHPVKTYQEVVSFASKLAVTGDVVLLSPACASWDMFKNYEERGDLFKKLVLELRG